LATGTAEREHALALIEKQPGTQRITVGADKAYELRARNATPHVAQNTTNRC
jgi:hypothetical protein